ncbi:SRR1-like protein isoform X1 [Leptidea sinapis]|uniref:SRR1-like domain-containing protein n=1 Tax=Leptidea sinapis TaxID=189913 RepID=A0A5E4R6W3_9NEOP|nr:SRR1-like protein isoform X1 [Leptidea sinapis]VVD06062.1 unnamed protein product [Leptidea sinapis]
MSKLDNDGFQVVSSKRASKNKSTKLSHQSQEFWKREIEINTESCHRRIISAREDVLASQYLIDVLKAVSNIVGCRNIVEIICFGLGRIGECNISRYQLALLLCLKQKLNPNKVLVHDPVFTSQECDVLKQLGLEIIKENNEGSYVISDQEVTLVYLPHCPKQLTNNFLWSNWSLKLENCILLCNSFSTLTENQPSRELSVEVPYIYKICQYLSEVSIDNSFTFKDIFNDTSFHFFPKEKLNTVPASFWADRQKPEYKETEEFITSLMFNNLKI